MVFAFGTASSINAAPFLVAHLAFIEQHHERWAMAIKHGVELQVQAAFGPADTSGNIPFFLKGWQPFFSWVVSIISWPGFPSLAASVAKMRSNAPSLLQRMNQ